jgi:hypothetical protein
MKTCKKLALETNKLQLLLHTLNSRTYKEYNMGHKLLKHALQEDYSNMCTNVTFDKYRGSLTRTNNYQI